MTDQFRGYWGMSKRMKHATIDHSVLYSEGLVHTNTIEGFWSLLKRAWYGTHHHYTKGFALAYAVEACFKLQRPQGLRPLLCLHPVGCIGDGMNRLYYGDCLTIMQNWPLQSVDLIYLDPPFNSNHQYNSIYKDETGRPLPDQIEAFCDMWELDDERERAIRTMPVLMRESGLDDSVAELWKTLDASPARDATAPLGLSVLHGATPSHYEADSQTQWKHLLSL